MISRITGSLEEVRDGAVLIDAGGGLCYEVMVPACDIEHLRERLGQAVVLHTIHYLEGDPARGGLVPRLVGFPAEADRELFRLLVTVKGVGIRKALRAMVRRPGEVAAAIRARDVKALVALPEIGRRLAERLITELQDKLDAFAAEPPGEQVPTGRAMPDGALEAVAVLVQLGERRSDAEALVERVLAVAPELTAPQAIIQQAYKLKAGSP
ncbi:MAG: hypothetical protein J7M21_05645 [Planctomycetes bacterium]|nr:hypothetical protein [Planctomycetota bacterium]